jgi:hypothetical protein
MNIGVISSYEINLQKDLVAKAKKPRAPGNCR